MAITYILRRWVGMAALGSAAVLAALWSLGYERPLMAQSPPAAQSQPANAGPIAASQPGVAASRPGPVVPDVIYGSPHSGPGRPGVASPVPATAPNGEGVGLWGISTKAGKVVYIVDHSGPMLEYFDSTMHELNKSYGRLKDTQRFAIITFAEDCRFVGPKELVAATDENKRTMTKAWMEVVPAGKGDGPADSFVAPFKAALALRPDVIFFVTNGRLPREVLTQVKGLNREQKAQINTIGVVRKECSRDLLAEMARDNGGAFRFVTEGE